MIIVILIKRTCKDFLMEGWLLFLLLYLLKKKMICFSLVHAQRGRVAVIAFPTCLDALMSFFYITEFDE
jgi:hypothetical protein